MVRLYRANAQFLEGKYVEAVDELAEVSLPTHEFKWRSHLLIGNIDLAENSIVIKGIPIPMGVTYKDQLLKHLNMLG